MWIAIRASKRNFHLALRAGVVATAIPQTHAQQRLRLVGAALRCKNEMTPGGSAIQLARGLTERRVLVAGMGVNGGQIRCGQGTRSPPAAAAGRTDVDIRATVRTLPDRAKPYGGSLQ